MNLITDRTLEDVLLGTEKGHYGEADLNRVEYAVAELYELAKARASTHREKSKPIGIFWHCFLLQPGLPSTKCSGILPISPICVQP